MAGQVMALLDTFMRQRAVYWAPAGTDDNGQAVPSVPVEIRCRWEDLDIQNANMEGRTPTNQSQIFVDRKLEKGGFIRKGKLTTVQNRDDPHANDEVWEIKRYGEQPNTKAMKFLRWVIL